MQHHHTTLNQPTLDIPNVKMTQSGWYPNNQYTGFDELREFKAIPFDSHLKTPEPYFWLQKDLWKLSICQVLLTTWTVKWPQWKQVIHQNKLEDGRPEIAWSKTEKLQLKNVLAPDSMLKEFLRQTTALIALLCTALHCWGRCWYKDTSLLFYATKW